MEESFVVSNTAKNKDPLSLSMISSSVYELHTGQTICLLRSVGSKQIQRDPFGFLTVTNEFNHSGAGPEIESYLDIIPAFCILSTYSLNGCFHGKRYFSGRFCTT